MSHYDAVIIGAGPVGLILAIGLAKQGKSVAIVEKEAVQQSPSFDGRVLALTNGSMNVLDSLGLWNDLQAVTTEIKHVHVSQKGYLGLTQIHADEMNVDALGYSVTSADLGKELWKKAEEEAKIKILSEAELVSFESDNQEVQLKITRGGGSETLSSQIIVGADGTNSKVREILNIPAIEKSYDAFGVIAKIETEEDPQGWSYERFTTEGPVALLPMGGKFHKAVMVVPNKKIEQVKAFSDDKFIDAFTEKMGERLGEFVSVSNRVSYPLIESYAKKMIANRAMLIGNASHTQHPVAAQGLNLGISDIAELLLLTDQQKDLGNADRLLEYERLRQPEHERIMGFTDSLIQIFETKSSVVGHLRGLGLMAMESMPNQRKKLAKMAMGL
jgi:2-octaprenyl-6-methoxyphenol hydroxylase